MNIVRRYTPFYSGHSLTDIFFRKRWQNFFHIRCFCHSTISDDPDENLDSVGSVREIGKKIQLVNVDSANNYKPSDDDGRCLSLKSKD